MPELESHALPMALPFSGSNELAVEPFKSEAFVTRGLRTFTASTYKGMQLSGKGDGAWDSGFRVGGGRNRRKTVVLEPNLGGDGGGEVAIPSTSPLFFQTQFFNGQPTHNYSLSLVRPIIGGQARAALEGGNQRKSLRKRKEVAVLVGVATIGESVWAAAAVVNRTDTWLK